jgi:hypothetical protein
MLAAVWTVRVRKRAGAPEVQEVGAAAVAQAARTEIE